MNRQEQLDQLSEIIETMMAKDDSINLIESCITSNIQFLQSTNNELQRNLYTWPDEWVDDYTERTALYAYVSSALNQVKNGNIDKDILVKAASKSKEILDRLISQYKEALSSGDIDKQSKIIQNVLVPHNMIRRIILRALNN